MKSRYVVSIPLKVQASHIKAGFIDCFCIKREVVCYHPHSQNCFVGLCGGAVFPAVRKQPWGQDYLFIEMAIEIKSSPGISAGLGGKKERGAHITDSTRKPLHRWLA